MSKRIFLEVSGESDFSAMTFEETYNIQKEYKKMIEENLTKKTLIHKEDGYDEKIYLKIHEFGEIDNNFIRLASDVWGDYDSMKCHDIFEVDIID